MPASDGSPPVKVQKTERSHEENQERAYIAASRRADRSLEARVQSAKMASEIHRRRTGRGLKVSEEIVVKEEMYEEEEDDLPRHYKYLTAHLQTNSPDMNSKVNAYITTHAAMATMARYNEVNRLFSESFPSAMTHQQQLSTSMYMQPLTGMGSLPPSTSMTGSPTSPTGTKPIASPIEDSSMSRRASSTVRSPTALSASISSPPALTPTSNTSGTPDMKEDPDQTPPTTDSDLNIDPQLAQQSSFTSELPNEVKMMAGVDMNDPMAPHFFGSNATSTWPTFGQVSNSPNSKPQELDINFDGLTNSILPVDDSFGQFSMSLESYGRFDTPGVGDGWESFVDFGSEQ